MRGFLIFLIVCLTVVGLALGAVQLDLVPDEVYGLVGYARPRGTVQSESSAKQAPRQSNGAREESPQVETADQLSRLMAESIERFEPELSVQVSGDIYSTDREQYLLDLVEEAYVSLRREYPHIFWMSMGQYAIQWSNTESGPVPLTLELNYCYTPAQAEARQVEIDQVLAQVLAGAPEDTYGALKYFHDWIVNNTVYDSVVADSYGMAGSEYAYNIDGVLLQGLAVCESYAKTYQLLCNEYGIPSRIAFGTSDEENHAWNYVQLEGNWYLVDCTADDPVSDREILRWSYFLKGWDGVVDDGRAIREIYTEDGGSYPALAAQDYTGGTHVQEQADQQAAAAQEVGRVEMQLNQVLTAGSAAVQPGGAIGTVSARGTASQYVYELSGEGNDDSRFLLDASSGQLTVGASPLSSGDYQIKVMVSADTVTAMAVIDFTVE